MVNISRKITRIRVAKTDWLWSNSQMRAQFNVAIIAYSLETSNNPKFLILKRSDENYWQVIAGGGEGNETPLQAAQREALEETGLQIEPTKLNTQVSVSVEHFKNHNWPKDLKTIPQFYFSAEVSSQSIQISEEHSEYRWVTYEEANNLLKWEGDRDALREALTKSQQ